NRSKKLFSAADSNRNHHNSERDPARQGRKVSHRNHNDCVSEDSHHDRRNAVQKVCRVPHDKGRSRSAELGQVNPCQKTDGNANQRGQNKQLRAAEDSVRKTASGLAHGRGKLSKEVPVERVTALPQEVSKDEK